MKEEIAILMSPDRKEEVEEKIIIPVSSER
jgi:hypothetical protein